MEFDDSGLLIQWKRMHWPRAVGGSYCDDNSGLPPAVSFQQISGVLIGIAGILIGCIVVLLVEICIYKCVMLKYVHDPWFMLLLRKISSSRSPKSQLQHTLNSRTIPE